MFEIRTLGNGVRLLLAPLRDAPSTAVFVAVAAGSRYEEPPAAGIAHFAEHMFFTGTERRPTARHLSAEIDGIGGEFNAFTGKELTAYYVKCAAESSAIALDVLADMVLASRFDAEEIEREKGVIVEEINMYLDQPRSRVDELYDATRYAGTPLARPIIGFKETVRAATRETFMDYLDTWYRPERLVIGLAGAVDEALIADAAARFGALEAVPTPTRPATAPAPVGGPRVALEHRESDPAHLILGVDGRPLGSDDRYAVGLLQTALGGGMSSRLFTEVRERRGLAYYVFAGHDAFTDRGSLVVHAGVDTQRVTLAVETICTELRRIADGGLEAGELEKIRRYNTGRLTLSLEEPRGVIRFGLRRTLLEGAPQELADVIAGVEAVTADDIQRVAQELIRADEALLAVVGPFTDEAPFVEALAPLAS